MIPGPAPVTTIHPLWARAPAISRAWAYRGSLGRVRAEPNIVALRASRYGAKTSKAAAISLSAALVIFRSSLSTSGAARRVAVARISKSWSRLAVAPDASRSRSIRRSSAGVPVPLAARLLTSARVARRPPGRRSRGRRSVRRAQGEGRHAPEAAGDEREQGAGGERRRGQGGLTSGIPREAVAGS